jgi:hypothetical protein
VRKLWFAGAVVAGGFVLFGATPAQADLLPGTGTAEQQTDERLADLLGRSNGVNVENPLRYSTLGNTPIGSQPVMQFQAGQNSPDLNAVLPGESADAKRPRPPAADVVGGALQRHTGAGPVRRLDWPHLPLQQFFGLPLFGGMLPDGGWPSALQQPTMRQAEAFDGGMPLLGGLGGLLPVNELPRTAPSGGKPDTSGLPAGGVTVVPAAGNPAAGPAAATAPARPGGQAPAAGQLPAGQTAGPAAGPAPAGQTTAGQPAKPAKQPKPAATPDDPRLHEEPLDEPVDGEAGHRTFSPDGRPVAGIDQQYK